MLPKSTILRHSALELATYRDLAGRGSPVVRTQAYHTAGRQDSIPGVSDETLKAVGPFYLVSMPGEVKKKPVGKCVTCRGLHILT